MKEVAERKYTCHSGGCPGSDMAWETEGEKYGVHTISYSFKGHTQKGKHPKILSGEELDEGFDHVMIANKTLKRYPQGQSTYVKSLLARNWFQVKNSTVVFAIAKSIKGTIVEGGTGWAVQMAVDNKKPVFVFDQNNNTWKAFDYSSKIFLPIIDIPTLAENFAGVGTRYLTEGGLLAIESVYRNTFKNGPVI